MWLPPKRAPTRGFWQRAVQRASGELPRSVAARDATGTWPAYIIRAANKQMGTASISLRTVMASR